MRKTFLIFFLIIFIKTFAQETEQEQVLGEVQVMGARERSAQQGSVGTLEYVDKHTLHQHFAGNLVQNLSFVPGVRSMDIGSGFSKPMIRGMGFNRVAVVENGIKQESQQWGADHGLELDAFNVDEVVVRKGAASLMYGSDAIGGVIEVKPAVKPAEDEVFGSVDLVYRSVNNRLGGSVMFGVKKGGFFSRFRYSEQHFSDFKIPTDTIIYLTQKVPIYGRKMKNTAGFERDGSGLFEFVNGAWKGSFYVSDVYQKTGFFPGAHGVPSLRTVADDGSAWNVELPFSTVNHLKISTSNVFRAESWTFSSDIGYQNNFRTERSAFHTHYGNQPAPTIEPDKELEFNLNTASANLKAKFFTGLDWEHTAGADFQFSHNDIGGYSFLMPRYKKATGGVFWISQWQATSKISATAGIRGDLANLNSQAYKDPYLQNYLLSQGYEPSQIAQYEWRSFQVNRLFGDYSASLGVVYSPSGLHTLKANVGRAFRTPTANELAANGVHHGTFRHEQGDPSLDSEKSWQLDLSYLLRHRRASLSFSPYFIFFENHIFLKPSGEWSFLPHAGQIYRYTETQAIFAGAEVALEVKILPWLKYNLVADYVLTHDFRENLPLNFSPPANMRNTVSFDYKRLSAYVEWHFLAPQNRIGRGEEPTPGANLFSLGVSFCAPLKNIDIEISAAVKNIFNTKYFNHLSFYRKVEIPEPGRNFVLNFSLPFHVDL